jgi:tetratricopeptide (TPR) repeat protein
MPLPPATRTDFMRLPGIAIRLGLLALAASACSLFTAAVEDDAIPRHEEETKLDLFAAGKNELVDEVRRNRKTIQTLRKEKEFLLTENLRLSNELRALEVRAIEKQPETPPPAPPPTEIPAPDRQAALDLPTVSRKARLTAYDFHNQGVNAFSKGDYDEALANFYKSVAINPRFHEAFTNIGVVYMTVGKLDKAIQNFQAALKIKSDFQVAQNYLRQAEDIVRKEEEKKRPPPPPRETIAPPETPKTTTLELLPAAEASSEGKPAEATEGTFDKLKDALKNLPQELPGGK